jgi:hypothetical protein
VIQWDYFPIQGIIFCALMFDASLVDRAMNGTPELYQEIGFDLMLG